MVLPASRLYAFLAIAAPLLAEGSSSILDSAFGTTAITTCDDLANLPTSSMTEDVTLALHGTTFECDEVTTVTVDGPHAFGVIGNSAQTDFINVRFEVSSGASLYFGSMTKKITGITFSGVKDLASDGGVFNVELGSSATFDVMSMFEHNSVQAGYSGGAVYAGGNVVFKHLTTFNGNSVLSGEDGPSGSGGALFVNHGGTVQIGGESAFTYNEVGGGGQGGAVANFGSFILSSEHATFEDNVAPAYTSAAGEATGGLGGAIFTGASALTSISGLQSASHNSAFSGGALYNLGNTFLVSSTEEMVTQFADNEAMGDDTGNGGHIYTSGVFLAQDPCEFSYGHATSNGGAVHIDEQGSFTSQGGATYTSNTADGECDDVHASGGNPLCQPPSAAGLGSTVDLQ